MARVGSLPSDPAHRSPARWTGAQTEDRRAERRELLIEAGFAVLGTDGLGATTVRAVCQAARLSSRYFYESFTDLDELLVAVYDRVVAQLGEQIQPHLARTSRRTDYTRAVIEGTVRFVDADRRRGRVLYVEAYANDALNRRRIQTLQAVVDLIAPRANQPGRVAATMLVGGFSELRAGWVAGRVDADADQVIADASEVFVALGRTTARLAARRTS